MPTEPWQGSIRSMTPTAAIFAAAAQLHRDRHMILSGNPADARYRRDTRPVRRARSRRWRRT